MGPRLISRGVDEAGEYKDNVLALQWGRGSLAAACSEKRLTPFGVPMLQWGRGSLAAAWSVLGSCPRH